MDEEAILDSVENTGRLVIVDESTPRCSLASDIAGLVASRAFSALKAPIEMVTAPHSPIPFARELEAAWVPTTAGVEAAARRTLAFK
jgi:pyruvate dehydrogenase E1 component beta subunit